MRSRRITRRSSFHSTRLPLNQSRYFLGQALTILVTAPPAVPSFSDASSSALRFSDKDDKISTTGVEETVDAPKDIDTLERISSERAAAAVDDDDDEEDKLKIHDGGNVSLDILDVNDINKPVTLNDEVLIPDIQVL